MNKPTIQDIPNHYSSDGLQDFTWQIDYASGEPVPLTDSLVEVVLRNSLDAEIWRFSSIGEGDKKLTILSDGLIQFPRIMSWDIKSATYTYDMPVTDSTGFVRTYFTGKWAVGKQVNGKVTADSIRGTVVFQEKGDKGDTGATPTITLSIDDNMILTLTTD